MRLRNSLGKRRGDIDDIVGKLHLMSTVVMTVGTTKFGRAGRGFRSPSELSTTRASIRLDSGRRSIDARSKVQLPS